MTDYEWYKSHCICVCCRREKAAPGRVRCPNCKDAASVRYEHRRAVMSLEDLAAQREQERRSIKALYDRRREQGLCIRCGKPALAGHRLCAEHNAAHLTRARRERQVRHPQIPGVCRWCENPAKPGYRLCEEHYTALVARLAEARRRSPNCKGMPPMLFGRRRKEIRHA